LFEGARRYARGEAVGHSQAAPTPIAAPVAMPSRAAVALVPAGAIAKAVGEAAGFGYETMFLARARPGDPLDVVAIRTYLDSIGESVLVAGDGNAVKVHVHNERPDLVLAYALGLGDLSKISVENLDQQALDVRETR